MPLRSSRFSLPSLRVLLTVAHLFWPGALLAGRLPPGAALTLTHPDDYFGPSQVGAYQSSTDGFSTKTYWIEGPKGLILIDTQFLLSAAKEAVEWAEQATGKRVVLAVVLHPNPDKFNGTAVLKKRGIRVITSEQVRALIPAVHEQRKRAFYDRYQPDYPADLTLPDSFGDKTTEIAAAGTRIKLHVLGPGCSEAHVVVEWEKNLFVGDLVANGGHLWLELGRTEDWKRRMEDLLALKPDHIHPGRGPSGDDRLLRQTTAYLTQVETLLRAERPSLAADGSLPPSAQASLDRVQAQLEARYPGHRFALFAQFGLAAIWRRLVPAAAPAIK